APYGRGLTAVDKSLNSVQTLNVVQDSVERGAGGGRSAELAEGASGGRRARNRLARHRAFLRTAMRIVRAEGLDGLTMARLADELDCAVGTVYTYFPSKGALVAAVQREAIEKIGASYLVARADTDRLIGERGPGPVVAALARAVGLGRFWAATPETFPEEAHLIQLLMTDTREVL